MRSQVHFKFFHCMVTSAILVMSLAACGPAATPTPSRPMDTAPPAPRLTETVPPRPTETRPPTTTLTPRPTETVPPTRVPTQTRRPSETVPPTPRPTETRPPTRSPTPRPTETRPPTHIPPPPGMLTPTPTRTPLPRCVAYYTVRVGDTLYSIIRRYGVSAYALMAANGISNPNSIHVGQRLCIPPGMSTPLPTATRS
jgi:outer membrane biosynthesis protein TonB